MKFENIERYYVKNNNYFNFEIKLNFSNEKNTFLSNCFLIKIFDYNFCFIYK